MTDSERGGDVGARLNALLTRASPALVRWLRRIMREQADAISDADLAAAVARGDLDAEWIAAWQQRYSAFVVDRLEPAWRSAAAHGSDAALEDMAPLFDVAAYRARLDAWIATHGGELVVNLSRTQHDALRAVLRHHIMTEPLAPADLAKLLRPMIGLTPRQADSIRRLRSIFVEEGLSSAAIELAVVRASSRARAVRSARIARTELATAYNRAMHLTAEAVASAGGFDGPPIKIWHAQADERRCSLCGPLHGLEIALSGEWATHAGTALELPPAHPGCRCVALYTIQAT